MCPPGHRLPLLPHPVLPRRHLSVPLRQPRCLPDGCLNGFSGRRPSGPPPSPCRPPSHSALSTLSCLLRRSAHARCSSSTACASPPCGLPGPSVLPSATLSAPPMTLASLSRNLLSSSPIISHALLCSSPFPPCAPHVVPPACGRCCTCACDGTPRYAGRGGYIIPIAG